MMHAAMDTFQPLYLTYKCFLSIPTLLKLELYFLKCKINLKKERTNAHKEAHTKTAGAASHTAVVVELSDEGMGSS